MRAVFVDRDQITERLQTEVLCFEIEVNKFCVHCSFLKSLLAFPS